MKKLMLATAIAASMTGAAHATVWNASPSGMTSGMSLVFFGTDLLDSVGCPGVPAASANMSFGGTVDDISGTANTVVNSALTLSGVMEFDPACGGGGQPRIKLTYSLSNGVVGTGVTFTSGTVQIDALTTNATTYQTYGVVDASVTNIPCVGITVPSTLNTPPATTAVAFANPSCDIDLTATFGGPATLTLPSAGGTLTP